jgi:N6-adenosine-specific RNA methylase IME4
VEQVEKKLYSTILLDPPWNQQGGGKSKRGADKHYPLLKEKQILEIVAAFLDGKVATDAHMYMWTASNHLPEALRIIEALGFKYINNIVWAKTGFGLGQYFRGQHELCLFATKGRGFSVRTDSKNVSSLLGQSLISTTKHSAKPVEMYDLVERRSKGPYLEMFARNTRSGWDSWGNEVPHVSDDAEVKDVL